VSKFNGRVACLGVEGIIKDGKGGEMLPLPVNDDAELGAYLLHVRGMMMAPTFNVQLMPTVAEEEGNGEDEEDEGNGEGQSWG